MLLETALLAGLISLSSAAPVYAPISLNISPPSSATSQAQTGSISPELLTTIDPKTASCTGAPFPAECADATRAASSLNTAFSKYSITTPGERAAIIALELFESGSFQYNINHTPGVPGQGTKNMQSPAFNLQYAKSLFDAATVSAAEAQGPVAVLDLVSKDDESFGSGAWFLSTVCTPAVREGLASGSTQGWVAYLTQCVGTTDTEARDVVWIATKNAMGLGGS